MGSSVATTTNSTLPFIIWAVCVGLAAIIAAIFIRNYGLEWLVRKEGFEVNLPSVRITSCPKNTTEYITEDGDTNCCEGDIVNGHCGGLEVCSLSPKTTDGIKTCSEWLIGEWTRRAETYCSRSMPYYFGNMQRTSSQEGCSASHCSDDGSQPQDPNAKKCRIYSNQGDELSKGDSCMNMVAEERMVCPQADAIKVIQPQTGYPALLTCTYTPRNHSSNDMPVNCYEPTRYQLFMQAKGITQQIDPTRDIQFCPASKAYYVDGTLKMKDAKGLPSSSCPSK
jgi:hypothetical protein